MVGRAMPDEANSNIHWSQFNRLICSRRFNITPVAHLTERQRPHFYDPARTQSKSLKV